MNAKADKNKALDLMIAIGTKKGLGVKGEEGGNYKEPSSQSEDTQEDTQENEVENTCETCNKEMVCSGCNKSESQCTC